MTKLVCKLGVSLGILAAIPTAWADILNLSPKEAHSRYQNGDVLIVDVRTAKEWSSTGVADGAVKVTLQDPAFQEKINSLMALHPGAEIAFICRSGNRSMTAAKRLAPHIEGDVYNVTGGMLGTNGWKASELPLEANDQSENQLVDDAAAE